MIDKEWLTCSVCEAEFKILSPLDKLGVEFCPFCGSGVENEFDVGDMYDDEDPTDNF